MSGKRKKLKRKLARRVLSGKITVDDARRRLGRDITQKSAVPSLAKAHPAWPALSALPEPAPRYQGDDAYVRSAFFPIARPAVTKAAAAAPREHPLQVLNALKGWQTAEAAGPGRPAHYWTPVQLGLLRESEENPDPKARWDARAALDKSLAGPELGAAASARMLAWGAGPDGVSGWQAAQQPPAPGLRIAPPGTAGR